MALSKFSRNSLQRSDRWQMFHMKQIKYDEGLLDFSRTHYFFNVIIKDGNFWKRNKLKGITQNAETE